jgi:hypothetical protein
VSDAAYDELRADLAWHEAALRHVSERLAVYREMSWNMRRGMKGFAPDVVTADLLEEIIEDIADYEDMVL